MNEPTFIGAIPTCVVGVGNGETHKQRGQSVVSLLSIYIACCATERKRTATKF